jgi:predicted transcriptional regulator
MDPELREIRPLRKALGITQKQLATAAQVSQSLVAKVEAGRIDPSFSSGKRMLVSLRTLKLRSEPSAKQLMERHVITCRPSDKVRAAIVKMQQRAISQLPVTDGDNVVGLLTESTIIRHLDRLDETALASDMMEEAPPIVPLETPRRVVAELLSHYSLLLVKERGKLRGIITKADLLRTV